LKCTHFQRTSRSEDIIQTLLSFARIEKDSCFALRKIVKADSFLCMKKCGHIHIMASELDKNLSKLFCPQVS